MSFLADLEASAFSEWLTLSMLGAPTLIAVHSAGMAVAVGVSLVVTLRLVGLIPDLDARLLSKLLTVAVWGFAVNLVTGLGVFVTRGTEYVASGVFLGKMILVVAGATALLGLRQRLKIRQATAQAPAADGAARSMSLFATATWFGAVIAGRLIAYLSDLYLYYRMRLRDVPATDEVSAASIVVGGLSLLLWAGVIVCGRMITFYAP